MICALCREEAGFALLSRAERFSPPASQIREDGAPHLAALCCCGACRGWAARPRECRHAGSTGWAEEVEGAAGTGSPLVSPSRCAPSSAGKPVEERAAVPLFSTEVFERTAARGHYGEKWNCGER